MPPLTPSNALIRAVNVTASEAAALISRDASTPGGHPYATPEGIYDRITVGAPEKSSQAMRIGSFLESSILRLAEAEYGFHARANSRTFEHRGVRLCATPDAFAISPLPWALVPERALIEIKMSGRPELWRDVPSYIEWQARGQLACTDRDVVYVIVLAAMRLVPFPIYRDSDKEAELTDAVQRFWSDHIDAGVRPEPAALVPAMSFGSTAPFSYDADPATEKEAKAS